MKKLIYLIVLTLILGLVLTGCLLSNVGQVPTTEQSGISYLTKGPSPSLVGLWRFNDNADDSSGTIPTNNGTVYGATYVDSPMGKALSFDGVDDYVTVLDSPSLDITGSITVEGWIKLTSFSQPATVAGKWEDIGGINKRGYLLAVHTDGTPRFYISTNGINYPSAIGPALSLDIWYHLAGTYDGANINLYVDTAPSSIVQTGSIFLNDQPLLIGANDGFGGLSRKFTDGTIDEVRIWNVALSQAQIGDVTPPLVTITAPDNGGCYKSEDLPALAYGVVEVANPSPGTEVVTGWSTDEGVHTVTVTATDGAGNVGSASVTYTVDNTDPVVTINAPADGGFYPVGAIPALDSTVIDNLDPAPVVDDTGYSTDPGEHTVTVTATDCAGNEGSDSVTYYVLENFVTGGGKINMSTLGLNGKKAALTFGGTVGVIEDVFTVGQFQIVDHTGLLYEGKGAVSWHCNNFTYLEFSGESAESPEATHDTAIFEGEFTSNRGGTETLRLRIKDNGEPGAGDDTFSIDFFGHWVVWTIDGGNFQVHNIDIED